MDILVNVVEIVEGIQLQAKMESTFMEEINSI